MTDLSILPMLPLGPVPQQPALEVCPEDTIFQRQLVYMNHFKQLSHSKLILFDGSE